MKRNFSPSVFDENLDPVRMEPAADAQPIVYRSDDLLRETRQVTILHRGQRYTLRETRAGKLILYK